MFFKKVYQAIILGHLDKYILHYSDAESLAHFVCTGIKSQITTVVQLLMLTTDAIATKALAATATITIVLQLLILLLFLLLLLEYKH